MGLLDEIREVARELGKGLISHHPDLKYRYHVISQQAGQAVDAELQSYSDYAKVYQVYVWVHKAINRITEALAPLPVRVVDRDGKALDGHRLTELFAYVNDTMSSAHLWGIWVVHMMLGGEEFLELVPNDKGKPVEIWPRRPDKMAVVPDEERPLYPAVAGYVYDHKEEYGPGEVIHDKFYNPLSDWRGLAPIAAVRSGIVIDLFAQSWSRSFLKKGARPDYALVAPEGLTPTEREEYEQLLLDKFGGPDNWHRPIILEKGITDIKVFSWAPKDIEWMEQRKMARDEVGGLFGVPDEVMGYGRDTYENMDAAHRWFWKMTVKPLAMHRDTTLTSFFTRTRPMLRRGERIATDFSGVEALQEDLTPKAELAKTFWAMGVPFNRLDEQLGLGIGAIPGGDQSYLPLTLLPMGSMGAKEQRRALAALITGDEPASGNGHGWRILGTSKGAAVPEYGSQRHKALWKAAVARFAPYERRMKADLDKDFAKQKSAVLEALDDGDKGRLAVEALVAKWRELQADATQKQGELVPVSTDDFFDLEEWVAYFALAYEALYTDMTRTAGAAVLADFGLDMPFDLGAARVQRAIRMMRIKFTEDVNETTQDMMAGALREILQDAAEDGWAIPRIQEEIKRGMSEVFQVRRSDYERERIARTEMHKASEMGNLEGARQTGLDLAKSWLAALDGRERDTHREAHLRYGESPIPLDADFEVGGDLMRSPGNGNDPAENINCRCSSYYLEREA